MANVFFRRGTQAKLNQLKAGGVYTEGSFYLTTDTNRLYFAQSGSKLVDLNQYIHIYTGDTLPSKASASAEGITLEKGDFYYWTNHNILAIYTENGNYNGWMQINPDSHLNNADNIVSTDFSQNANTVQVTTSIRDVGGADEHTASGSFSLKGGDNVHLEVVDGNIVISADNDKTNTTYIISTTQNDTNGTLTLTPSSGNAQNITIKGESGVNVKSNDNNEIIISGQPPLQDVTNTFDQNGNFLTSIGLNGGDSVNSATGFVPTISYGGGVTKSTAVFANGTASLDTYTKTEVDDLLAEEKRTLDAMSYLGTVNGTDAVSKLGDATRGKGDTYKANADFTATVNGKTVTAKVGDLIIASGSDDNITWEVIPSGNDQFIQIEANLASKMLAFKDVNNGANTDLAYMAFTEDKDTDASKINITATNPDANNPNGMLVTISHGAHGTGVAQTFTGVVAGTTQQYNTSIDVPTISGIKLDKHGHVAEITTATYHLTDTHATLNDPDVGVTATNNIGNIDIGYQLSGDAVSHNATFGFDSTSLTIKKSTDNNRLTVNLEWENF